MLFSAQPACNGELSTKGHNYLIALTKLLLHFLNFDRIFPLTKSSSWFTHCVQLITRKHVIFKPFAYALYVFLITVCVLLDVERNAEFRLLWRVCMCGRLYVCLDCMSTTAQKMQIFFPHSCLSLPQGLKTSQAEQIKPGCLPLRVQTG